MSITLGNVFAILEFTFGTDKTWDAVSANTAAEQTVNAKGVKTGDFYIVTKPTHQAGLGYVATARCAADNVLTIKFENPTAGGITPTAEEEWKGILIRAEIPKPSNAVV